MLYRSLGKTGLRISAISFGAGPVSTLMVGSDRARQVSVVQHAVHVGINWFDTAATYGGGQSERNLGTVLAELDASQEVHVATKVRLTPDDLGDIRGAVRRSLEGSLDRLRLPRVTLLQLHNSITLGRGDEPTSITPADVLGRNGVVEALRELREEGLVQHLGLTGIGQPEALQQVVRSNEFETIQVPYHLLNPSAGQPVSSGFRETNYGNIISACAELQMGVLAIRVLAGGALIGNSPSPHTLTTPFFPLALYQRDVARAARLRALLGPGQSMTAAAIRYVLSNSQVHSALIGLGEVQQIDEAIEALTADPIPIDWSDVLNALEARDVLL